MADNSRYSNWRRRHQAWREGQEREQRLRQRIKIAKEAFEWEARTAAHESQSGDYLSKILVLEAYKLALSDSVRRSQCDNRYEIFSFGQLSLIHEPAVSSFTLEEIEVQKIIRNSSVEFDGWAEHEIILSTFDFPYGDGFSEFLPIEQALLEAMIAYFSRGGALSQSIRGTRLSSDSSFFAAYEIYN
mgnify:FL=1